MISTAANLPNLQILTQFGPRNLLLQSDSAYYRPSFIKSSRSSISTSRVNKLKLSSYIIMAGSSHLVSSRCGCDLTRPDIKPQESPFPDLLNLDSRDVLPAVQSDIIQNAISAAIRDVSQLDQEMLRLETSLAELRRKHDEKQQYIMAHKALISTIRQVPPEIITDIFRLCLRGCPRITPRLASICRRWRTIIFSSPQLCASISLVVNSKHLDSQIALADMWLSHSGEYPLSIDLRDSYSPLNDMHFLMEVFVARSEQWHTVHLSMRAELINCLLGAANRLHRLETLSFGRDIRWTTTLTHISTIFATAPRLRSLRLFNLQGLIPQLPWKQLQDLIIDSGISAQDCLDIMKLTSNLLKCEVLISRYSTEITHLPRSVTLPLLRSMSLLIMTDWDPANFLSTMRWPAIEDLHISCDLSATTVIDALLSVISDGTLVKLALRSPGMIAVASMVAILQATPTLQELLLKRNSASCISPEFLERFNGPIAYLVPELQKLEVDCYMGLNIFGVEKIVKGRCLTNHQNAFKHVVLKCRKKDPVERVHLCQIRDELGSGLHIRVLWQDNTPVDLDSF
ncbi:hypothetical protein FIBSPDRAFT_935949 [Athelia psychrophila]|uniref:F-box domain-containing protein n=1 Tax=Athelia psychrophila TaxID=1759441 RepID=A0A166CV30_9AGAM|nr:hypothetical protein FIBSPDRAFT_935949 [Fibularhizoctonia sp. CBS 109695]